MRGFHDRVHAAQRQRDQGAGNPFAAMEDLVRIRAGEAAAGFVLNRELRFGGDVDQALDDMGMIGGAVADGRTRAELDAAIFVRIDAGGVGGVGDVEANTEVRLEAIGSHHCAVAANFLLHGIEADEGKRGFFLGACQAFHHLGDDVAADSVVEGAADEAFMGKLQRPVLIDSGMTDADSEGGDFRHARPLHRGGDEWRCFQ